MTIRNNNILRDIDIKLQDIRHFVSLAKDKAIDQSRLIVYRAILELVNGELDRIVTHADNKTLFDIVYDINRDQLNLFRQQDVKRFNRGDLLPDEYYYLIESIALIEGRIDQLGVEKWSDAEVEMGDRLRQMINVKRGGKSAQTTNG